MFNIILAEMLASKPYYVCNIAVEQPKIGTGFRSPQLLHQEETAQTAWPWWDGISSPGYRYGCAAARHLYI